MINYVISRLSRILLLLILLYESSAKNITFLCFGMNQLLKVIMNSFEQKKVAAFFFPLSNRVISIDSSL
jgi:hypothetical protein